MIQAITIENFRGIERLAVDGFGRVNLIIGKNDSGKTAVMEAMVVARRALRIGDGISEIQPWRGVSADVTDFDGFWRPVFRGGDAERGFGIELVDDAGARTRLHVAAERTGAVVAARAAEPGWRLVYRLEEAERHDEFEIRGTSEHGVTQSKPIQTGPSWCWIGGAPNLTPDDVKAFSNHKAAGRDATIVALLGAMNPRVVGLELLAPSGQHASIFVRVADSPIMLPLASLGEGSRRFFEIAISLGNPDIPILFCDEIENGLHHSVQEQLWSWIAKVSAERNVKVFATTHSEECVHAAARAFNAANDDGFRLIRLDRREHETTAAIYDRHLVASALDMDIELRG